jgi:Ser/Thr protein kinase RdoA (MazF antagonist)
MDIATPFASLDPPRVLAALDAVGLRGDGRLLQLNSYENRVYQAYLEDGSIVVAKFYRPGRWSDAQILEEHAFALELAGAEVPVAPPLARPAQPDRPALRTLAPTLWVWCDGPAEHRFCVSRRVPGRAPELDDDDALERIGMYIARIHAVGARARFAHRLTLEPAVFGRANVDWLAASGMVPVESLPAWRRTVDAALDAVEAAFAATAPRALRLHGDCHLGNILWTGDGPCFVDLDDTVTGPAVQDLWMLLAGDRMTMTRQLAVVLDGYERFRAFDRRELALVEPLRTLRMVHHSAWIARRWADPAFPIAFPHFASPAYWAQEATRLAEQIAAMKAPALAG